MSGHPKHTPWSCHWVYRLLKFVAGRLKNHTLDSNNRTRITCKMIRFNRVPLYGIIIKSQSGSPVVLEDVVNNIIFDPDCVTTFIRYTVGF